MSLQERSRELLVPFDFPDRELLEQSLEGARVRAPQRGSKRDLVDLADQNARHLLEELRLSTDEADERATNPLYELQRELAIEPWWAWTLAAAGAVLVLAALHAPRESSSAAVDVA